jgi:hypothetical protein
VEHVMACRTSPSEDDLYSASNLILNRSKIQTHFVGACNPLNLSIQQHDGLTDATAEQASFAVRPIEDEPRQRPGLLLRRQQNRALRCENLKSGNGQSPPQDGGLWVARDYVLPP